LLIGIVGKTNVGKSTFFSAATLIDVEIANRPFKTIKPNRGIAYVRTKCVCSELNVKDKVCHDGIRFLPVELLDVAGLVPGAHLGRGLGNKFLDDLRQADVFIHVVDASGSTDEEGRPVQAGTRDPIEDVKFLEKELDEWIVGLLSKDWEKTIRVVEQGSTDIVMSLYEKLSGLGFTKQLIEKTLVEQGLWRKRPSTWTKDEIRTFVTRLRKIGKPSVIAANKADIPPAIENIERMRKTLSIPVIPTIAEAELALRKASKKGIIKYLPGDTTFEMLSDKIPQNLKEALERLSFLLKKFQGTGVQQALETAVFHSYDGIVVYPVEDINNYSDKNGNVLPDAFILKKGSKPIDLARKIHTDLAKGYLYAIDAKTKQRLSSDYELRNGDVIKIVATA
jgi:ribosome-binding ATPase YchF (GTP1/OBG family)